MSIEVGRSVPEEGYHSEMKQNEGLQGYEKREKEHEEKKVEKNGEVHGLAP